MDRRPFHADPPSPPGGGRRAGASTQDGLRRGAAGGREDHPGARPDRRRRRRDPPGLPELGRPASRRAPAPARAARRRAAHRPRRDRALLRFGAFLESFRRQDERELRPWQRDRVAPVVRRTAATSSASARFRWSSDSSTCCPRVSARRSRSRACARTWRSITRRWNAGRRRSRTSTSASASRRSGRGRSAPWRRRELYPWRWSMAPEDGPGSRTSWRASVSRTATSSRTRRGTQWSSASCATPTGARWTASCRGSATRCSPSSAGPASAP